MYCHESFWKSPEFPRTFLFMTHRSSKQVLESSRRIEKVVEISSNVLCLAYDSIVVSWLFLNFLKEYIYPTKKETHCIELFNSQEDHK